MPVGVDPAGHEHDCVDYAPALADLHRQGVGGRECERAGVGQRPGAEGRDPLVQVGGHGRDLRLGKARDPEGRGKLVHPPGGHAQQVSGRDHADQRRPGPLAPLEQPLREVRPGAQLRECHVERAEASVQVPMPVAVVLVDPIRGLPTPLGAADRASASADNNELITVVSRCRIRSGDAPDKASPKTPAGSTMRAAVIVMLHSRVLWKVHSKDHAVTASSSTTPHGPSATPLSGTRLLTPLRVRL